MVWAASNRLKVPPRASEIRTVLTRNGFACERSAKHETWIRRDTTGAVEARTFVSHGNGEIKVPKTFKSILRQSKKSEEEFYRVLRG
jgi:predicted RNA binding protein YcfA (HicA-like mRNA interferase family)